MIADKDAGQTRDDKVVRAEEMRARSPSTSLRAGSRLAGENAGFGMTSDLGVVVEKASYVAEISDAEVVLDGVGDGSGEGVHEGFGFGFDHDAGESFGAGVADDDASVAVELAFGVGDGLLNGGHGREGKFFADTNVADDLREDFESVKKFVEGAAGTGHDFHDAEGGEEAVAGGGAAGEDDVAGLLAAEGRAGG